jgi:hypothetical protein
MVLMMGDDIVIEGPPVSFRTWVSDEFCDMIALMVGEELERLKREA